MLPAFGLEPGEGYYQNTWIFFNNLNVGVTKNISLGLGLVPTFLLGTSSFPFWVIPKISIPVNDDNFHFAASGLLGGLVGASGSGVVGVVLGTATAGNTNNNITFGIGYGYADGQWSNLPAFNLSGMIRTGRKTYLVSENYFFKAGNEVTGIMSFALRWAPENFAVDFGLIRPFEDVEIIGVPWIGITLPFGK